MSADDGSQKSNSASGCTPEQKLNTTKMECAQKSSAEKIVSDKRSPSITPVQNISNHRMHRSSVRPFFCCGSQLSLNSITEFIDVSAHSSEKEDTELTDFSDCDEVTGLIGNLTFDNCSSKHEARDGTDKVYRRQSRRKKAESLQDKNSVRKKFWTLKLRGKLHVPKRSRFSQEEDDSLSSPNSCVCTSYRKTTQSTQSPNSVGQLRHSAISFEATSASMVDDISCEAGPSGRRPHGRGKSRSGQGNPMTDAQEVFVTLHPINFDELYPTEDIDERRIAERAKEMEEGIDVPDIWIPQNVHLSGARGGGTPDISSDEDDFDASFIATFGSVGSSSGPTNSVVPSEMEESCYGECSFPIMAHNMMGHNYMPAKSHSQVDYIHCLVPDILEITKCSYYWGVMDRYQAELLLDRKPEGTFLLRDSAQDEYLFSVSFRRYGRSLHARIEQWNHKFSFDSHDPGVFASDTVCGLIEHYKDPSCCMFFEPMLTSPLHRNFPFSLQHLCRSAICNYISYDGINLLPLPNTLREYMKYYHYKQKVRMRRFDTA